MTAAAALFTLAVLAAIAQQVFGAFSFRMGEALTATSLIGGAVAVVVAKYVSWKRSEIYDEIVLTRYRHVGGDAVRKYAAALVSAKRRRQYAAGLNRFVETAGSGLQSPLPINRVAVLALAPRLDQIATALRSEDQMVTPEGMVLVRRLICEGATSPLFAQMVETEQSDPTRDLERALDRIDDVLVLHAHEQTLALAS